jgi:DNA-binding NarL/FixJ family response regulator
MAQRGEPWRVRSTNTPSASPTPRQLEVLRARCEAGSRKEAAALLGISPETVRWHLGRLFERCGCTDDAQAAYRHHDDVVKGTASRVA